MLVLTFATVALVQAALGRDVLGGARVRRFRRTRGALPVAVAVTITVLAAIPFARASAQAPAKVRIGWLAPALVTSDLEVFRPALRDLGWVEGENIVIEQRHAGGKFERIPDLAAELVRLKVDVIVTSGSTSTTAAQKATSLIPVVFVTADPVERGFVASYARPGGNLTGVASLSRELSVKMLQMLREAFPRITRVGVFFHPVPTHRQFLREMEPASRALSLQVVPLEVGSAGDIDHAAPTLRRERVQAILVLSSPVFNSEKQRLVNLAAKTRLPAMYEHRHFVEAGGLMSYGPDHRDSFRRAAALVDRILRGAKPAELPVEQPTKIELVINARTAKALGLEIPPAVLHRADEFIQ